MEMFLLHFFTVFYMVKEEWRRSKRGREREERGRERDNYQAAFYPKLYFTQTQNNSYHSKLAHAN